MKTYTLKCERCGHSFTIQREALEPCHACGHKKFEQTSEGRGKGKRFYGIDPEMHEPLPLSEEEKEQLRANKPF